MADRPAPTLSPRETWQPMESAPRDRRITLRAEKWVSWRDEARVEVFEGCKWCEGGTVRHPAPYWRRLPSGYTPIGWQSFERNDTHSDNRAT